MLTQRLHAPAARFTLSELCTAIGDFRLGPISLSLQRGDYLVLMGASGCGKTTLLKTIAGLLTPSSGEILLDGVRMDRQASPGRRVGYVPQHSLLFPHLSVAENVRFGLRYTGMSGAEQARRYAEVVALLEINAFAERNPHTLSGGETRRVALARALAINPALLLLDEPLSMLDPDARYTLLEILRRIPRETGVMVIHVTHLREEAEMLDGLSAVMARGRLLGSANGA